MTPEEVIAASSPLWQAFTEFAKLGIGVDQLLAFEPAQAARAACLILEELGWGDAGLASSLGVSMFPRWVAAAFGNQHLLELTPGSKLGCWATTEPGHGSDQLDPGRQIFHPGGEYGQPDFVATLFQDRVVINGRKADWISNGTIAEVCILYCAADTGLGPDPDRGCVIIVPMDAPGVSRGAPLDKLGQRALNQGAVIFDNVVLPVSNVLAGPDDYQRAAYQVLVLGNRARRDPRQERLRDLDDSPCFERLVIEHFFLISKELEPGKSVEGASWADHAAAEAEVEASRRRLRETQEPGSLT